MLICALTHAHGVDWRNPAGGEERGCTGRKQSTFRRQHISGDTSFIQGDIQQPLKHLPEPRGWGKATGVVDPATKCE